MSDSTIVGMLTDFGLADGYVGVMKAVLLTHAPNARIVDISHGVAPQDIEMGAWTLGMAWRYFPVGSVLLCVVDPGVGGSRRAIALRAHDRFFVGPDNGLFTYPLSEPESSDQGRACVRLDNPRFHLPAASATFHGRDIFAPCAAALARGAPLSELGSPVEPIALERLRTSLTPRCEADHWIGRVAHVDTFGNLITNIGADLTRRALGAPEAFLEIAGQVVSARATHFAAGPVGQPFFLQDSSGALAIAMRDSSAAQALGAGRGATVILRGMATA